MGKRNVRISYLADADMLFVHFETKAGYYDALPNDDNVQARYDENGKVIGFMVEGLSDIEGWLNLELADTKVRTKVRTKRKKGSKTTQADSIRQFVVKNYIEPARNSGSEYVKVRAGDVSKAMELLPPGRLPNVCNALRGEKLRKLAKVELVDMTGPSESTTTTFRYRIQK